MIHSGEKRGENVEGESQTRCDCGCLREIHLGNDDAIQSEWLFVGHQLWRNY